MSTIKSTQTQAPRERWTPDPTRHYVRVQKDSQDYESPLENMLDQFSPTDPNKDLYRLESDDRKVSGDRRLVMLSCSKEDHEAMLKANDDLATGKAYQVETDESKGVETFGPRNTLVP